MSEKVNLLIEDLRSKFNTLHTNLLDGRSDNERLNNQLNELNSSLASKEMEIEVLKATISDLNQENELIKNEKTVSSEQNDISEEKINELVNEIDFCIEQLKK